MIPRIIRVWNLGGYVTVLMECIVSLGIESLERRMRQIE